MAALDPLSLLLGKKQNEQQKAKEALPAPVLAPTKTGDSVADISAVLGRPLRGGLTTSGYASGVDANGGGDKVPESLESFVARPRGEIQRIPTPVTSPSRSKPPVATSTSPRLGKSSNTTSFEDMLENEKVFVTVKKCFLQCMAPFCEIQGRLLVTNFRLKFQVPRGTLREDMRWMQESKYFDFPVGCVEESKEERTTSSAGLPEVKVKIQTKDLRTVTFLVQEEDARDICQAISAFGQPGNTTLLFAFKYAETVLREASASEEVGWNLHDAEKEYLRMGIETESIPNPKSPWHVSRANADYSLCSTYPAVLALPKGMSSQDLRSVANFRKRGRLPVLSWCGGPERNYCGIWRCSQTTEGLMRSRRCEDQQMVECIRVGIGGQDRDLLVIDLRPWKSAWANKAGGGGFEGYARCRLVFGGIDNIHAVRDAWRAMTAAVAAVVENEVGTWFKDVAASCWYDYIGAILHSTRDVVREVAEEKSSAMVHCSDGWDRTAQATSLSMLCLDPFYRTQAGFLLLIQKEFCSFGHRFRTRLALGEQPTAEYSPVFIQWLECVFQLCVQFPRAFEFSPAVLLRLAHEAFSNRYGTFLCDSEAERLQKVAPFTFSLWTALLRPEELSSWRNPRYDSSCKEPLVPLIGQAVFTIWEAYWFRYHPNGQRLKAVAEAVGDSLAAEVAPAASSPRPSPQPSSPSQAEPAQPVETLCHEPVDSMLFSREELETLPGDLSMKKKHVVTQVFGENDDEDVFAEKSPK
eukprot:TRINITY_DN75456_c0_g1_i1.p1 TRINITY_DN75456_c0_g1~~TRINITY_DN75456_c0_g1_i1.p1  ORF type:complete len:771 (+),score=148.59 TRINITY_DN75456_c0_g1_i1:62-2314(+)